MCVIKMDDLIIEYNIIDITKSFWSNNPDCRFVSLFADKCESIFNLGFPIIFIFSKQFFSYLDERQVPVFQLHLQ